MTPNQEKSAPTLPTKAFYRHKPLFCGINAAAEIFNEKVKSTVADIPNQINVSDDLFVFGSNVNEHDKAFHGVLKRFEEKGLTVNADKCEFYKSSITFMACNSVARASLPITKR